MTHSFSFFARALSVSLVSPSCTRSHACVFYVSANLSNTRRSPPFFRIFSSVLVNEFNIEDDDKNQRNLLKCDSNSQ